jgi:hypothetical protein
MVKWVKQEAFLLECYFRNAVNREPIKRPCIASIILRSNYDKRFDKTKDELALLLCFLFDYLVYLTTGKKQL